jgi:hypothetical protein
MLEIVMFVDDYLYILSKSLHFTSCYFYNRLDSVYQLVPCLLKYSYMRILQHIS